MGTIQGTLRESCTVRQRSVIRDLCQYGLQPIDLWSSQKCLSMKQSPSPSPPPKLSRKCTLDNSEDQIFQVNSLKQYPFSSIGFVSYQIGKHTHYGSGFLISKNVVLTSASNLYSLERKEEMSNVCFIPRPLCHREKEKLKASQIYYPQLYSQIHKNQQENDSLGTGLNYGVIVLENEVNLQDYCGFLGVDFKEEDQNEDSTKSVIGYAQTESKETKLMIHQNKVTFDGELLSFPLPFDLDYVGGPILQKVEGECLAIGIHIGQKDGKGVGVRFTKKVFQHLNEWLKIDEEEIDLRNKQLGKAGVKELVKQKSSFHTVNLSKNKLGTNGLKHFPKVQWTNLHHLDLGGNSLGKEGIEFLVRARIPNLRVLNLWGNDMKKEGIESLVLGQWSRLQFLNIYDNELGYEGLEILVKKNWPLLNSLNLGKNSLDKKVVSLLTKSSWVNLVCLNLWGNDIKESRQIKEELTDYFLQVKYLYF